MKITVYTDGAAKGNPGPGGLGVVMLFNGNRKEIAEAYAHTTNNRMELLAVIRALESLKLPNLEVVIYTDSKYVHDSWEKKWLFTWEKKNWKNVKNPDLWKHFLELSKKHQIKFKWVKGHAGDTENERCDVLATDAATFGPFKKDSGYELIQKNIEKDKNALF